jgi:hypothetical protein
VLKQTHGKALYEVSKALGHTDVSITAKHYARWIMTTFSDSLRGGLGLVAEGTSAPIIPLVGTRVGTLVENDSERGQQKTAETCLASGASVS